MTASQDAVGYVYMNVGIQAVPPSGEGLGYIYMNVGVVLVPSQEGISYIYLNVDAAVAVVPHVWSMDPPVSAPGSEVKIYGTGLRALTDPSGAATAAYFGTQPGWDGMEPISAANQMSVLVLPTVVAASGNAYTSARSIPAVGAPNVEHTTMTVEIPIPATTSAVRVGIPG